MSQPSILVVEDNLVEQKVIALLLGRLGFDAFVVSNAFRALDELKSSQRFCAILINRQLPVMNGLEATVRIRDLEREGGRHTPVIALTACAYADQKEECIDAGMDDFLSKPYTVQQLEAMLRKWVRQETTLSA